jgi:membrane peptidoglycan carboxypeptidase
VRLPLYDVHWTPAVIVQKGDGKKDDGNIRVGLPDGRIMPLTGLSYASRRGLGLYDVVYVNVVESRRSEVRVPAVDARGNPVKPRSQPVSSGQAQLRARPTVQGAALVLENKTGRILAMAGSFSYPLSQLNRTWQTQRQPGSAIKPITYLTALAKGLQPNTLVPNDSITLPPIGSGNYGSIVRDYGAPDRPEDYWSPRNADYSLGGVLTLRRGLENSVNVVTAHLLDGGINSDPVESLDEVCATAKAAKIYTDCVRYYPFVLGAQPVHMIDLAAFYAAVANEGARTQPHAIDAIESNGRIVYEYPKVPLFSPISAADGVAFYQLKTILQGVVARGTARAIGGLSPYVAGKTGTTEDAVDGWFIGFTNDVTIAVWVGYDNGNGKRVSLGSNATGARVSLPIFKPILEAIWAEHIAPKAPLSGPSPEVARQLIDVPIDYTSGEPLNARARNDSGLGGLFGAFANAAPQPPPPQSGAGFVEHFRRGPDGHLEDTQYQIVPRESAYAVRSNEQENQQYQQYPQYNDNNQYYGGYNSEGRWTSGRSYYPNQGWAPAAPPPRPAPQQPVARGLFQPWNGGQQPPPPQGQGSFWGGRYN